MPLAAESLNRLDWKDDEPDCPNHQILTIYRHERCIFNFKVLSERGGNANALMGRKGLKVLADKFPFCRIFAFLLQKLNNRNIRLPYIPHDSCSWYSAFSKGMVKALPLQKFNFHTFISTFTLSIAKVYQEKYPAAKIPHSRCSWYSVSPHCKGFSFYIFCCHTSPHAWQLLLIPIAKVPHQDEISRSSSDECTIGFFILGPIISICATHRPINNQ